MTKDQLKSDSLINAERMKKFIPSQMKEDIITKTFKNVKLRIRLNEQIAMASYVYGMNGKSACLEHLAMDEQIDSFLITKKQWLHSTYSSAALFSR